MSIATTRILEDLEAQQNGKRVKENLVEEEIKKIVERNDDVDANQRGRTAGDALIRRKGKGIVEIKDTPQPTPIRSLRTHSASLSLDKEELQELTASNPTPSSSKPTTSSPKPKPDRSKQYKSIFLKMSRRYGYMFKNLKQSFMPGKDFKAITETVHATLKKVVPLMADKT
ncbi:hypothetical protein Tco_1567251, partial [Tanacetum coccineum]